MAEDKQLSEEHLTLLQEADQLGMDTLGYRDPKVRLDNLRAAIARQTQALAKEAMAKRRLERRAMEEVDAELESIHSAFDETMADTRGVLVRQVEWSEWLPIAADENEPRLTIANGVTGFEAGKNEKVLTVEGIGVQSRIKHVDEDGLTKRFMLYAFKATLAQNVHTTMVSTLVAAQGSNEAGEVQQPPQPSKIITPDDDIKGPNRSQRRHPRGR